MNYKITVQYDGTGYSGWQTQGNTEDTIQGILETKISELIGEQIEVQGSGRTDAGVHALGQVANFHTSVEPDSIFLKELNKKLPASIAVTDFVRVDERFHARLSAVSKTYRYRIGISPISNVFERKFIYPYTDKPLDTDKMRQAAAKLVGTHDFRAFCGNRKMKKSTVRTVEAIELSLENEGRELRIEYTGNGFLQNMVRIMTGTLIEIGNGSRDIESIEELFVGGDRTKAGYTAPACGLILMRVRY